METLFVYADFDWLAQRPPAERSSSPAVLIGELGYESLRGSDSYSFQFDKEWLRRYGSIMLSADINNYPGQQYTLPGRDIFGCFSDALPDRWGRTLLNRREQILAKEESRQTRRLSSFDYLMGIDDASRMGGFRFSRQKGGAFINSDESLRVPPLTDLRSLVAASQEIERCDETDTLPDKKWICQLVHPGTSLGGARPKATVVDEDGAMHVAKFPSRKDDHDVALWEHLCHLLASRSGISAAETRLVATGEKYHTLLSRRFDRRAGNWRIHFASAMTMLGLTDGCNAQTGNGYLDIVDFILQNCCDVDKNLHELYRRVAFNIAIRNTDDHFRNHGFLLTPKGWTLSPAYDMNPTLNDYQALLVNSATNESNLQVLLDSSEEYMITRSDAQRIIEEVLASVKQWMPIAVRLGISMREMELFEEKWRW
jgi:serine/threonine-protein kinase HipA